MSATPDRRDAATRAVDKLIDQKLLDPFQRYNIGQVIREEYAKDWRPFESAPRDGTEILAAIRVRNTRGESWWERHVIKADDETGEIHPDYHRGWEWEDYEFWTPLPPWPEVVS